MCILKILNINSTFINNTTFRLSHKIEMIWVNLLHILTNTIITILISLFFFLVITSLQQTKCIKLIYSYTCIYIYNTRASKYAFQTNFVIHTQHTHLKLSYRILDQIPIWIKSPILTKWSISSSISPNKHKYDDGIKMLIV